MEAPWSSGIYRKYPHIRPPFCQWTHLQQISTQALAKNHHPSTTVRQETPAPPFPHTQSLYTANFSWRHLHITSWSPSSIAFTCQFRGNKGECIWFLWGIEPGFLWWQFDITTTMIQISVMFQILQFLQCYYHSPGLTLDIFPFPVAAHDIFLCPTTPQYLSESIQ